MSTKEYFSLEKIFFLCSFWYEKFIFHLSKKTRNIFFFQRKKFLNALLGEEMLIWLLLKKSQKKCLFDTFISPLKGKN